MPIMIAARTVSTSGPVVDESHKKSQVESLRRLSGLSQVWARQVHDSVHRSECALIDPFAKVSYIDFNDESPIETVELVEVTEPDLDW